MQGGHTSPDKQGGDHICLYYLYLFKINTVIIFWRLFKLWYREVDVWIIQGYQFVQPRLHKFWKLQEWPSGSSARNMIHWSWFGNQKYIHQKSWLFMLRTSPNGGCTTVVVSKGHPMKEKQIEMESELEKNIENGVNSTPSPPPTLPHPDLFFVSSLCRSEAHWNWARHNGQRHKYQRYEQ